VGDNYIVTIGFVLSDFIEKNKVADLYRAIAHTYKISMELSNQPIALANFLVAVRGGLRGLVELITTEADMKRYWPLIALIMLTVPVWVQAQTDPTCADFFQAIAAGNPDSFLRYTTQIFRQLDAPRVGQGCESTQIQSPGERGYQSLLNMLTRMCNAHTAPGSSPAFYDQIISAYQQYRAAANFAANTGYGDQRPIQCR
jgi:hypothetical protein